MWKESCYMRLYASHTFDSVFPFWFPIAYRWCWCTMVIVSFCRIKNIKTNIMQKPLLTWFWVFTVSPSIHFLSFFVLPIWLYIFPFRCWSGYFVSSFDSSFVSFFSSGFCLLLFTSQKSNWCSVMHLVHIKYKCMGQWKKMFNVFMRFSFCFDFYLLFAHHFSFSLIIFQFFICNFRRKCVCVGTGFWNYSQITCFCFLLSFYSTQTRAWIVSDDEDGYKINKEIVDLTGLT